MKDLLKMNENLKKVPKYIQIKLIFEDDELNQIAAINIDGCKSISMTSVPEFKKYAVFNPSGEFDHSIVAKINYTITVDYGDGIKIDSTNSLTK